MYVLFLNKSMQPPSEKLFFLKFTETSGYLDLYILEAPTYEKTVRLYMSS